MLVLASTSPRRSDILTAAGIPFSLRPSHVPELRLPHETPDAYVQRLAQDKATAVPLHPGEIILGADTVVTIQGQVLEKPADALDASRMLRLLSGRRHHVLTGICLRSAHTTITDIARTAVDFAPLSPTEIDDYVASGEPTGKAGAYAIQGLASKFISGIDGCYFNVVGLPISLVYHHLARLTP